MENMLILRASTVHTCHSALSIGICHVSSLKRLLQSDARQRDAGLASGRAEPEGS